MGEMPLSSMEEGENLSAQRPDLFRPGKATMQSDGTGGWKVVYPDDIAEEVEALDPGDNSIRLMPYAADKRWRIETGGIVVDGHPVKSDDPSQRKVANLKTSFDNGTQADPVQFKLADGTFFTAGAAEVDAIYSALMAHVQACYSAEENARAAISAGTATTYEAVDAFFAGLTGVAPAAAPRKKGRRA